jgi:hypothetical protein
MGCRRRRGVRLAIAVLHERVWRWPPAKLGVLAVVVATIAGGLAGWAIAHAINSPASHSPPAPSKPSTSVPRGPGHVETVGAPAKTWSGYVDAGGREGPTIQMGRSVKIACRITGFRVQDGDTWWYRVASAPWSGRYYVSADAFYNNGQTAGSLQGTKLVDLRVPAC